MSLPNPYARYRQTQLETASQIRMIVMLHDGAIRFLNQALALMESGDRYGKSQALNRALAIIDHLWSSVNPKEGGEIAANLARLFPYLHSRVSVANAKNDQNAVQEVIEHLRNLRDAWAQVETMKADSHPNAHQAERGELSMAA